LTPSTRPYLNATAYTLDMRCALCALCALVCAALVGCGDDPAATPACAQDCAASGQACDPQTLSCVACLFSSDCPSGQACIAKVCVEAAPSCAHDDHCAANAPNRFCASTGRCEWSCLEDRHCTEPPNTRCDPEAHACISPTTSSGADADADALDPTTDAADAN
jgi:hypothetical protein